MYTYKYPRPAVTTSVIITKYKYMVLLGKRQPDAEAYPNAWCIPGGFLNAKVEEDDLTPRPWAAPYEGPERVFLGETVEEAAIREVKEETNITIEQHELKLFQVRSDPEQDPRGHVVHIIYSVDISEYNAMEEAGDDLAELKWFDLGGRFPDMAFDHRSILMQYRRGWK